MAALGFGWADVTATQVYTIFDIHPLFADEIVRRAATPGRFDLAFRAPGGAGPQSRDGCTRHRSRIHDLTRGFQNRKCRPFTIIYRDSLSLTRSRSQGSPV
jgi:hypothetical protein